MLNYKQNYLDAGQTAKVQLVVVMNTIIAAAVAFLLILYGCCYEHKNSNDTRYQVGS